MSEEASSSTSPSVSRVLLQSKQREIDAVRHLAGRAEFVAVISQLIHLLQRERGASSTFLASRGQRFAEMRRGCVEEVGPVELQLREMFMTQMEPAHGASTQMLTMMAWVLLGLDALDELRGRVERQALTAHDSVAAYSRLVATLVELIFHVADAALVPRISRLLVAFLHLVQGKEAAGQERAIGALLFASGVCTEAHQQRLVHLIDAQERSLNVFTEFADPGVRARWEQQQLTPDLVRFERLRRTLCAARVGSALDSDHSDAWFEVSSDWLAGLRQFEIELVQRLREDCAAHLEDARRDLQDSEGLLRRLRDNPPPHVHAVERFFDIATRPDAVPALATPARPGEADSLLALLQAQSAKLARMEAEFEAARRTLNERKVVERAKGALMSRLGMTEEAAFRALQKTSMDQNRRLLDVAEATLSLPDFAFARPDAAAVR